VGGEPIVTTSAVLRVSGELDAAILVGLRAEADLLILDDAVATLVVDLSETIVVEHNCIELLVHLKMLACENAMGFALRAVPPAVRSALRLAGLDKLFDAGAGSSA
jgi:anti-anti-sigma regulatory factor